MAIAKFHSIRGEKGTTALIMLKLNPFAFGAHPVYVPADVVAQIAGVEEASLIPEGFDFNIDDKYCTIVDFEVEGEVRRTTKENGSVKLKTLAI